VKKKSKEAKEESSDDEEDEEKMSCADIKQKFFPEKKEFWRKEALLLRLCFQVMLPFHVWLALVDIIIYHGEILLLMIDLAFIYINYYNHQTLSKLIISI